MKITVGQLRQLVQEAVVVVDPRYLKMKGIADKAIKKLEAAGDDARKVAPDVYKWIVKVTTYEDDPSAPKGYEYKGGPLHHGLAIVNLVTKKDGWFGELLRRAARDYRP